jgi:hypothetical protein
MHRARVQTGNPGLGYSRVQSLQVPGFPGIPGTVAAAVVTNNKE